MLKNFTPGSSLKPETNDYLEQYTVVCSGAEKDAVYEHEYFTAVNHHEALLKVKVPTLMQILYICIIQPCPFSRVNR